MMTYSYTQISQYLTCPRRYRHRYLDGWQEKDTRAAMLFGRAFEQALGAYFRREDPGEALFGVGCFQNHGLHTERATPGIGCCNKAFICWTASARTTGFTFANPAATCRSSSLDRFPKTTTSWPTSMPSESSTGRVA